MLTEMAEAAPWAFVLNVIVTGSWLMLMSASEPSCKGPAS